ncbi:MAG: CHASE4 domain-containing protein [Granulosicoccus sp.]
MRITIADGYLGELGMGFGVIVDAEGRVVWSQSYSADQEVMPFETVFPDGIAPYGPLLSPERHDEQVSGLIDTARGPAIVSSAAILWSNRGGPAGGHMVVGKLLDHNRMDRIGQTVLSEVDLLSVDPKSVPLAIRNVLDDLSSGKTPYSLLKEGEVFIYPDSTI